MNNVGGIHPALGPKPVEPANSVVSSQAAGNPPGVSDVVEISTAANLAAKVHELPAVRADLVARAKAEIEAGTYETPERIDVAVDRLLDDLLPELL